MSESKTHQNYIYKLIEYVKTLVDENSYWQIKADLPEYEKPSLIFSAYIPDLVYLYRGKFIIGEAKTFDDYNTEHSYKQYEAYFKEFKAFKCDSTFIISLPWELSISAQEHFIYLKKKYEIDVKIVIITDMKIEVFV